MKHLKMVHSAAYLNAPTMILVGGGGDSAAFVSEALPLPLPPPGTSGLRGLRRKWHRTLKLIDNQPLQWRPLDLVYSLIPPSPNPQQAFHPFHFHDRGQYRLPPRRFFLKTGEKKQKQKTKDIAKKL